MINAIWVDDLIKNPDGTQTDLCKSIVNSAYDEGIDITPFATYDEAYNEMKKYPSKWIAIILDVRNDHAIAGSENQDYLSMRRKVEDFRKEQGNSVEPFIFVFSADPVTISASKRYFIKDADIQSKEVYIKPNDTNVLFDDIKAAANLSTVYATYKKYEDIMNSLEEMKWSQKDQNDVFDLIKAIDTDNDYKSDKWYNVIRKLLETVIFDKLEKEGFMDGFLTSQYYKDTLNAKSIYVCRKDSPVPEYIKRAFHSLTEITQQGSHSLIVTNYTKEGKAPYLLKSCLFNLLTIIIWESQL